MVSVWLFHDGEAVDTTTPVKLTVHIYGDKMSLGPFKNKRVRVVVDDVVVSMAELTDIQLVRKGGIESKYGMKGTHSDRRHCAGKKYATFTVRRWFKTGTGTNLFYYLHNNKVDFDLEVKLNLPLSGFNGVKLEDCEIYSYRVITGSPNDIIGEEISGKAVIGSKTEYYPVWSGGEFTITYVGYEFEACWIREFTGYCIEPSLWINEFMGYTIEPTLWETKFPVGYEEVAGGV